MSNIDENSVTADPELHKTFLFAQCDKLVWSYFRKSLQDIVTDAGLKPVLLPIYV